MAENEKRDVIGFCMGYYMDNDSQMQDFVKHNKIALLWKSFLLMLAGNKPTWNKMLSYLRHKPSINDWTIEQYENILNNQRGDLLSVCVVPDERGKGYAQELMDSFLASLQSHGRLLCLLSVRAGNGRARRYYERNGFELYRTRGEDGLTYIKKL